MADRGPPRRLSARLGLASVLAEGGSFTQPLLLCGDAGAFLLEKISDRCPETGVNDIVR